MTDVTIRSATGDDVPAICDLAAESWHAAYDEFLSPETVETVLSNWYDPEVLAAQVADPTSPFLLAMRGDRLLGYANAGPDADRSDVVLLWRLYVHPDHWGEGVGSRLLSAVVDELREEGAVLELTVLAKNDRARRFYEERGFDLVDRKPTSLAGTSVIECVYRKPLARQG